MIIYTDGSAHPNPGPGGFGVIVFDNNKNLLYNYSRQFKEEKTTNNEMEIKAILYSFLNYGVNINNTFQPDIPIVYSDSAYCVNTFTNWMFSWERNNWIKKTDKKPPENLELIKAYYDWYQKGYRIDLRKVKGHSNIYENKLADKLATGKLTPKEVYKLYGIK